jgi:hypothetical protein
VDGTQRERWPRHDAHTLARDLDEVIQSYLLLTDSMKVASGTGASAFENVDAFRVGFLPGEAPCLDYVPQSFTSSPPDTRSTCEHPHRYRRR